MVAFDIPDTIPPTPVSAIVIDPCIAAGFLKGTGTTYLMPADTIAFRASPQQFDALGAVLQTVAEPISLSIGTEDHWQVFYRLQDTATLAALKRRMPPGVTIVGAGEAIDLSGYDPDDNLAGCIANLPLLESKHVRLLSLPEADPIMHRNPLRTFSLLGQADAFAAMAVAATPLLGNVCLRGQVTIWYAGPNTGKTLLALSLLVDAVHEGRAAAGNVFYINADDNGQGLAIKLRLLDDLGANTLVPGFQDFKAPDLITLLHKMADGDSARGVLVIIDTLKKFTSLMKKDEASAFAQACRRVAMTGGSVLGLAHINKKKDAGDRPAYQGTSDLLDDADAAYMLHPLDVDSGRPEKVVEFSCIKARGPSAERVAFAYSNERDIAYTDLLASVTVVDAAKVDDFRRIEAEHSDAEVIACVAECLSDGINTKMVLGREVNKRIGISARAAGRLIDRYTGDNPERHRWRFDKGNRGAQIYSLLPPPALAA